MNNKKHISAAVTFCMALLFVLQLFVPVSGAEAAFVSYIYDSDGDASSINVYTSVLDKGDINADTKINSRDLLLIKRYISGAEEAGVTRLTVDSNSDGRLNSSDIMHVIKVICDGGAVSAGNTALVKNYDADEDALAVSVVETSGEASFFEVSCQDPLLIGCGYFGITIKGSDFAKVTSVDKSLTSIGSELTYSSSGGGYTGYVFKLDSPLAEGSKLIEVMYDSAPAVGNTVYIDSVVFSADEDSAKSFVDGRAEYRTPAAPENKYVQISFDSEQSLSDFISSNHTAASYNSDYNALKLQVSGASGDPWILLDLEKYGISADEYKYIVYTSMIPAECNLAMPEGELFYASGDVAAPTAGFSNIYSQSKDGKFHSKIFELTNADFWTGTVHSLRFDYFCSAAVGDTQYVKSVIFCNTYEAAAAAAENREVLTTETKELFFYGKYDDGSFKLSYRMYVPYSYDSSVEYPVLLLLHGAGQRGTDGTYHLTEGFPYLFGSTANSAFGAIVLAPQCPEGYRWVETDWANGNYSADAVPESEPMKAAISVLNNISAHYSTDANRVYVSGMSMGGFGTWDALARHSDIFAAGVPICGGGDPSKAEILKNIPIMTYHGTSDSIVPARGTKEMYDTIVASGGTRISYTPMGGRDHFIWDDVYKQSWVADWLFAQSMADR